MELLSEGNNGPDTDQVVTTPTFTLYVQTEPTAMLTGKTADGWWKLGQRKVMFVFRQVWSIKDVQNGAGDVFYFNGKHLYIKMVEPGTVNG
jgi:hypothetical protein